MKKSNKIISLIMSAMMSISALPVISNSADTEDTENPSIILYDALPCYVDGKTAVFMGGDKYDFVTVTAPEKNFTAERTENTFSFTPEQDGTYIVSMVWLEETPIYYPIEIFYDLMPDIKSPAGYIDGKCNYFYPQIYNFEITYSSGTGTKIELIGERNYINDKTVSDIVSGKKRIYDDFTEIEYDFIEMETDEIFNDGIYYAFASRISETPFIYFDYGDENKKDKSVFCIINELACGDADGTVSVTGNAEITNAFYSLSATSGDLMDHSISSTSFYTLIEPTGDGSAEVYYNQTYNNPFDEFVPPVTMMLTVENGKFIPSIKTVSDDLMTGDMNFDERINIADAVLLQKYILGKSNLTNMQYQCADMNFDGIVDIFDMVLIRKELIL